MTQQTPATVETVEYVEATEDDKAIVAGYVEAAPRPDLTRPRNRRFLKSFVGLETAENNDDESIIFDVLADIDETMEKILGKVWVTWITSIPAMYQDVALFEYARSLARELGKG